MKLEPKERVNLRQNGFPYPKDSLEGICWLAGKGELTNLDYIANETVEIAGVKINTRQFLVEYLKGPDAFGKFIIPLTDEIEVEVKHLRKNRTLWLPYEISKKASFPEKFRMAPKGEYDHAEGHYNPRLRANCDYCGEASTEIWLILREKLTAKWKAIARCIFHCGYLQVKEVTYY